MGEYIQAGICCKVNISKSHMKNIDFGEVGIGLGKEISIDLYQMEETENGYIFSLKEENLEKGELAEFLMEQYKLFGANEEKVKEIIEKVKDLNKYEDIIEFAETKRYQNFQYSSIYNNIYCGKRQDKVIVEYELVTFYLAGKIEMECYNEFLKYIEALIKKDNPYRISGAVKVLIG